MGRSMNRRRLWICPYFKWDGKTEIHCEGGVISFPDKQSLTEYITKFCCANPEWTECTIADSLSNYYERLFYSQEQEDADEKIDKKDTRS